MMRRQRELAIGLYRAAGRSRRHSHLLRSLSDRKIQLATMLGGATAITLTSAIDRVIDPRPVNLASSFLAGLFDDLATWWADLSPTQQALIIAGALAAVALLGTGVLGATVWSRIGISLATRMMLSGGLRGRVGYALGRFLSQFMNRVTTFPVPRLQHSFKHAADFGINGPWSKATGEQFRTVLEAHIRSGNTLVIQGTFRGQPVTHFLNPRTSLNVMRKVNGDLLSGWRLGPDAMGHLLRYGRLGGG